MKLKLDVTPDLAALMAAEIKAGERAVTTAMREAAWTAQDRLAAPDHWRRARSAARQEHPRGDMAQGHHQHRRGGAGLVEGARHRRRPRHRPADPLEGRLLAAIPTPAAGRGLRGGRITPGEWERRRGLRLRFVYRRRGPSLLVADRARINKRGQAVASRAKTGRNQVTAPIFLLVPQVKLPKRLDLDRDAERAHDSVPGLIVANWVEGRSD